MLKIIFTGIWVVVVALGSVYASIQFSKPLDPAAEAAKKKAVEELVRGEMVTFPVLERGIVEGYFLAKTSYIADKTKLAEITLPIPELLTDELYTALVGDRVIRLEETHELDLKEFREKIKAALNKRLGTDVVLDVIVEQIDYLSKDDIRNSQQTKSPGGLHGKKIVSEKLPNDVPAASSTH